MASTPLLPRVRLYTTLRTAHLERARELAPATILYRGRRYDFDEDLGRGLHLVAAGSLRAARLLLAADVRELEVNEPLMRSAVRRTALGVAAVRLGGLLRRRRTLVATYAIENDDRVAPGRRAPWTVRAEWLLSTYVASQVDRVVFGTQDAREVYEQVLPRLVRGAACEDVPALPAPCGCGEPDGRAGSVLFVGAFEERKGFDRLVADWPTVVDRVPWATLTLVGSGRLLELARTLSERPEVTLVVDPPREEVHRLQREHAVAVLASRRTPTWREQVGLPIVEALAHGCTVVSSSESGLAPWLHEHGHVVVGATPGPALADAIVRAVTEPLPAHEVLASLPVLDGRLEADRRLFGTG